MLLAEKFMRDNIVGTVLVLSLVIWIPLVCIFQSIVSKLSHLQWRIQDLQPGGGARSSAKGAEWPSAAGGSIEAPKAPRGGVCGGSIPLPNGEGSEEGALPPPQKSFRF